MLEFIYMISLAIALGLYSYTRSAIAGIVICAICVSLLVTLTVEPLLISSAGFTILAIYGYFDLTKRLVSSR